MFVLVGHHSLSSVLPDSVRVCAPFSASGTCRRNQANIYDRSRTVTSTPINIPTRSKLVSNLTLLTLTLAIALATACGSSWGEGGDPAAIVADIAHELEIYDISAYLAQDIPDDQRARFEEVQAQFERYGIDFADVNTFAKAIVGCCDYNSTTLLQGARLYVLDGNIDLDLLRSKLEEELFESSEASGYELWESRGLREDFLLLNRVAVGIIADKGYVVVGDTDGVKEVLHNLNGRGSSEESAMRQALDRLGDGWRASGLVSAQTYNTANTHCAPGIRYNQFCQSTAYYTTYAGDTLKTVIVAMYASDGQALSESEVLERNLENTDIYEPVDVEVVDVKVDGLVVEATVEHEDPLRRKVSSLF